jgi:hypothetical protein
MPKVGSGRRVRALLALAVVACQASHDQSATVAVDSAGVRIVTIGARPEALEDWTVAPIPALTVTGAEAGDSSAFALVGAARWLSDGRLVVADDAADRLFVFDSAGALQRTHGRSGDGPGEFRDITTLEVVRGDTLGTFDARLRRLSFWHPDDGFVRSISLADDGSLDAWPAEAWAWQDSLVVVLQLAITPLEQVPPAAGMRRWPMRAHLTLRDGEGKVLRRSPEFEGMYTGLFERGDMRLPFSNRPFAAVGPERVYFGSGALFTLSYLNREFTWSGDLRWPSRQEPLTAAEVEAVRADAQSLMTSRLPEQLAAAFAQAFAPEILPDVRPQIGRVIVAPDGLVWIERFEARRLGTALQKPGDRWTILKPDGEPVAQLRLPPDARLEAVRSGRVILVRRDSLDVQAVAVHTLVRP